MEWSPQRQQLEYVERVFDKVQGTYTERCYGPRTGAMTFQKQGRITDQSLHGSPCEGHLTSLVRTGELRRSPRPGGWAPAARKAPSRSLGSSEVSPRAMPTSSAGCLPAGQAARRSCSPRPIRNPDGRKPPSATVYRQHREQTRRLLLANARANGQLRLVEMSQQVLGNLDRIITALEADDGAQCQRAKEAAGAG
jgi:hypothetical protein